MAGAGVAHVHAAPLQVIEFTYAGINARDNGESFGMQGENGV